MPVKIRETALSAITGAAYASLTVLLSSLSYGPIQFRVSEVLCVLPFYFPSMSWGLFAGCALANIISGAGVYDMIFGSLATLIAALLTARIGKPYRETDALPGTGASLLACLMPVFVNAPVVGAVLAFTLVPHEAFWPSLLLFGAQVGLGELAIMTLAGLPLLRTIPRLLAVKNKGVFG